MSPVPAPGEMEEHDDFMSRCHSDMSESDPDMPEDQRNAICEKQWRDDHEEDHGQAIQYPHIVHAIMSTPWAITPGMMATIINLISFRASGQRLSAEEIRAAVGGVGKPQPRQNSGVAVLPLFGVIAHRAGMMSEMSGGTSVERFTGQFRDALSDPGISAIVLDVNSPGGTVNGVSELADEIFRARAQKPVYAIANSLAASAAYWLSTSATEFSVIPSGEVGSIGVLAAHEDMSKALARQGINTTLISAGKYKTEGSPYGPLEDDARGAMQERVDAYYDQFVDDVARGRGVKSADVRAGYGQGRVLGARKAKSLGMVDRVESYDALLARVVRQHPGQLKVMRAEDRSAMTIGDDLEDDLASVDLNVDQEEAARVNAWAELQLHGRRLRLKRR